MWNKMRIPFFLFLFISFTLPASAEEIFFPSRALSLMEVYRLARENDPAFGASRSARKAGIEKLHQGRSLLLPSINLRAGATSYEYDISYGVLTEFLPEGTIAYNEYKYSVVLNQPLFHRETFSLYGQAKLLTGMAEIEYSMAEQNLILRVAQAYFDILLAKDNLEFILAQKAAISRLLEQAKLAFEVGKSDITAIHEAQAGYDLAVSREIMAQNELEIKKEALSRLIGFKPPFVLPLREDFKPMLPLPNNIDTWIEMSESDNFLISVNRSRYEMARLDVDRNRGQRMPTLDLVGTYSFESADGGIFGTGSDTTARTVGITLQMPIFTGGGISSKIRESVANREKARQELEDTLRMVRVETYRAFLTVKAGVSQVKAFEQALVSSRSSLKSTGKGFSLGLRTGIDVLNAQQQLFGVKKDLASSKYNLLLSLLRLKAVAGSLSENDVEEINRWIVAENIKVE